MIPYLLILSCNSDDEMSVESTFDDSSFFIEAKIDGEYFKANYICKIPNCEVIAGWYSDLNGGTINFRRLFSETDPRKFEARISHTNFRNLDEPVAINANNFTDQSKVEFTFNDETASSKTLYFSDGTLLGEDSFIMTVTSNENDIIEGTFSGQLTSGGSELDDIVSLTEGKFKVKLFHR